MHTAISQMPSNEPLSGISFSSAMHSLMAVDEDGRPLTKLMLWADTRSSAQASFLKNSNAARSLYEDCGVPLHPMTPLCKIMWLRYNEPEHFKTAHKFISMKEYLFYHLTGKYVIDHSIASSTGMFNIHQLQWDSTALEFAGITKYKLSTPVSVFERFENIEEKMRQRLGLQQTIPLVIGSSDGCLANIGSGVTVGEGIAVTISTSMAVRITTRAPYHDTAASLFNYALEPNTFVCGGGSNNGSLLLHWMAENILQDDALKDPEKFMEKALSVPAGCDGLVFLPYLLGERAPVWDADATGVITGFKFHHRQAHLMRALIEGLTMNVCIVVERLLQVEGNSRIIKASGGFTNSVAWVQMLADISNLPVLVDDIADASAIGAVMVAGYSLGFFTTLTKPVNTAKETSIYYPRPQEHLKYMDNYAVFKTLYAKNLRA